MTEEEQITFFAKTNFRNREVPFGIKTDDRRRHMYVIGKTGMGKTTMMENMAIQDIRNGHGVCFIDPHGDSVVKILDFIPNDRINDVVYFNPADMEHPLAFNILEAVDTKYKHLVASGLMGVFTKIWANLWSARMEYILNNTILALLDSPGNTMLGIARMYIDKKYRKKIVDNIKDPMVKAFWVDEFAQYSEKYRTEAIAPIQNKVGQFLSSGIIRNIVGQPRSTIDLRSIMDNRKILLMDLSKGKVGEDNSALLGAMVITKLQLAALSRVDILEEDRKDFYLYVDEFQNFVTDSFATILSEARKYRLNLTIGHQYIGQLVPDKNSTKVRDAVFGNVGTMVAFRVGAQDAEFLETEFDPTFTPNDIVNLPKYNIILRLMINGVASDPFSAATMPVNEAWRTGNGEKVIKVSRERYANPVGEVEERIGRWMGAEFHEQTALTIGQETDSEVAEHGAETALTATDAVQQTKPGKIQAMTVAGHEETPAPEQYTPQNNPEPELTTPSEPKPAQAPEPAPEPKPWSVSKTETLGGGTPPRAPQQNSYQGQNQNRPQTNSRPNKPSGEGTPQRFSKPFNKPNDFRQNPGNPGANFKNKKNSNKNKPFAKPAQKNQNPIWNTVAELNQKKLDPFQNPAPSPQPQTNPQPVEQQKVAEQQPQQTQPIAQPSYGSSVPTAASKATDSTALQPGEVHKF